MTQLAEIIDFAAARARMASSDSPRARLEAARRRLTAEAQSLPRPWHAGALSIVEWCTDYKNCHLLDYVEKCRSESAVLIRAQEVRYGFRIVRYATQVQDRLDELRAAIDDLRGVEHSGDRRNLSRKLGVKRRALTIAKRNLLATLFHYGRRRIDWQELE